MRSGGSTKRTVGRKLKREVGTTDAVLERNLDGLNTKVDKIGNGIGALNLNQEVDRKCDDKMVLLDILPKRSVQETRIQITWLIGGTICHGNWKLLTAL